ncbi:MAG: hypothetical protein JO187_09030, partial [Acidobacteria bacterium]|nr:hypothetical protein [Acidobacteriota bacterium]
MKNAILLLAALVVLVGGCKRKERTPPVPKPAAYGTVVVEVSGGKQVAQTGATLDQPIIVQ